MHMAIKNNNELANTITNYFHNNAVQEQIASFFERNGEARTRMSAIMGNIITYFVATRSEQLLPQDLHTIMVESTQSYGLGNGPLIVKAIKKQLQETQGIVTANDILNKLKENYIDNGFYMHAFSKVNAQSVQTLGLRSHHNLLNKEKEHLLTYIPYEWHETSYRVFATNNYHSLYKYGLCSPEWLYNCVGNDEAMKSKNNHMALEHIMERAKQHPGAKPETLISIEASAKTALDYYFNDKGFAIAVFDRNIKKDGYTMFRCEHYEPVVEKDFDISTYANKASDEFFVKHYLGTDNPTEQDILAGATKFLLNKYSETEASSCYSVEPHQLSVAIMPDLHALTK